MNYKDTIENNEQSVMKFIFWNITKLRGIKGAVMTPCMKSMWQKRFVKRVREWKCNFVEHRSKILIWLVLLTVVNDERQGLEEVVEKLMWPLIELSLYYDANHLKRNSRKHKPALFPSATRRQKDEPWHHVERRTAPILPTKIPRGHTGLYPDL